MRSQSYRVWLAVAALPVPSPSVWEPLIEALERTASELGPILSWTASGQDAVIVMCVDQASRALAVKTGIVVAADALDDCGLGSLYPARVSVDDPGAG